MTASNKLKLPIEVSYYGLDPEDSAILNFPKFQKAIEIHGYILLNGAGDEIEVSRRGVENLDWLTVVDPETNCELYVIIDDTCDEEIELEGFIDVLKAMDDFCKSVRKSRLFETEDISDVTVMDEEYDWKYDFSLKSYIEPIHKGSRGSKRKNREVETFSQVFGMSATEYASTMIP